jgi:hypothetical protein
MFMLSGSCPVPVLPAPPLGAWPLPPEPCVIGDIIVLFAPPVPLTVALFMLPPDFDGELHAQTPSSSATYKAIDAPILRPLKDTIASTPLSVTL